MLCLDLEILNMGKILLLPLKGLFCLSPQKLEICSPEGNLIIPRFVESFQPLTKRYSTIIDTHIPKPTVDF